MKPVTILTLLAMLALPLIADASKGTVPALRPIGTLPMPRLTALPWALRY